MLLLLRLLPSHLRTDVGGVGGRGGGKRVAILNREIQEDFIEEITFNLSPE